jgi:hypothetical protein
VGCDTKTDIILTEIPVFTPTKEVAVAIVAGGWDFDSQCRW